MTYVLSEKIACQRNIYKKSCRRFRLLNRQTKNLRDVQIVISSSFVSSRLLVRNRKVTTACDEGAIVTLDCPFVCLFVHDLILINILSSDAIKSTAMPEYSSIFTVIRSFATVIIGKKSLFVIVENHYIYDKFVVCIYRC